MDLFFEIMGVIGLVILLSAFIINTWKHTRKRVLLYNSMQFVGAALLCIYAYVNSIWLFVALQAIWAVIALFFIYENVRENKKQKSKLRK